LFGRDGKGQGNRDQGMIGGEGVTGKGKFGNRTQRVSENEVDRRGRMMGGWKERREIVIYNHQRVGINKISNDRTQGIGIARAPRFMLGIEITSNHEISGREFDFGQEGDNILGGSRGVNVDQENAKRGDGLRKQRYERAHRVVILTVFNDGVLMGEGEGNGFMDIKQEAGAARSMGDDRRNIIQGLEKGEVRGKTDLIEEKNRSGWV
jgi:hypothetical protein